MTDTSKTPTPNASGWQTYKRLLSYVKPYWWAFLLSFLGFVIYAGTSTAFAHLMKLVVDSIESGLEEQRLFFPLLVLGIFVVRGIGTFLGSYFMAHIGRQLVHHLRMHLFERLLVLPAQFYDHHSAGHLVSKLTYNVEQVTGAATKALKTLLREGLFVIGLMGYLFWVNWKLALTFIVIMPLIGAVVSYASKRFRKLSKRIQVSMGDLTHVASEAIGGYRVVRSFGGSEFEYERFRKASNHHRRQSMKMAVTKAINTPVVQLIIALALSFLVWMALHPDLVGSMSPGEFIAFLTAAGLMAKPARQLTEINDIIQKAIAASSDIFAYMDEEPEADLGTKTIGRAKGKIDFQGVCFKYGEDQPWALKNISFTAKPGEMIALVGRSGSGKSTLASLIPRFYEANEGAILLDDQPLSDITLKSLRAQIGLVTQQVTLFNDTLAANIAYGMKGVSRKDVEAAAQAAYVTEFTDKMEQGLDTLIGDNGVRLSGGQRQRIAIARAILKDAPILILDEATSALDTESERYIQKALEEVTRNRTTFVIAHRLSTVESADRILVMADGEVVEKGTHEQLIQQSGAYAQLHQMQFKEQVTPQ